MMKKFSLLLIGLWAGFLATQSTQAASVETVQINLNEYSINTSLKNLQVGHRYKFIVNNQGQIGHEMMLMPGNFNPAKFGKGSSSSNGKMGMMNGKMGAMGNNNMMVGQGMMKGSKGDATGKWEYLRTPDHMALHEIALEHTGILDPGANETIEYTIKPKDKKNGVLLGCFLVGHYEAGMKLKLAVN